MKFLILWLIANELALLVFVQRAVHRLGPFQETRGRSASLPKV